MSPLEILRAREAELRAQIDANRKRGTELLGKKALTEEERAEIQTLTEAAARDRNDLAAVDAQIRSEEDAEQRSAQVRAAQVATGTVPQARAGGAQVTREERTYTQEKDRRGEASFFADSFRAVQLNNSAAMERLARHGREVEVEREGVQTRATTTSSFAGLVVPQYLIDQYALVLRAGRPLANICNRMPLPDQGMQFLVPRGTTGASAASQATENANVSSTDEVWANVTVNVATIAGQQDISRQSLERGTPGIDQIVYNDLGRAYSAELDRQVANGSGASGQMLGILQTAGINASTAYGAAATPVTFFLKTAGGLNGVASAGTAIAPNVIVMHPRRWYWLSSQVDSANRPLVTPVGEGLQIFNGMAVNTYPGGYSGDEPGGARIVGYMHGLPVIIDTNIPTNVGGGSTEDVAIEMDSSQALLWEDGDGMPRQLRFEQTLGNQLTVKLVCYGYAAFTAGRYPVAFSKVGGADATGANGQQAPAF